MEKVRIGNDIQVKYTVLRDGLPESFDGATNIVVTVKNEAYGKIIPSTFSILNNIVTISLDAADCVLCGKHRVTLSYNRGNDITIDALAFELVQFTSQTGGTEIVGVEIVTVNISGDIGIAIPDNNKIDLDGLNSNIDKLHFKPDTLVQLAEIGDVRYSPENRTLEVKVSDTVSIQLGQEMQTRIKNDEAIQINNGQMVYIDSASGANPLAKIASTTDANIAQRTFGMATENIALNGFGAITTEGLVRDIDTSAFTEGDMLWLGVNGSVTNIEPVAPTPKISVGMVLRSNVANGVIYVKIRAIARNQKLSDVYAPTLTGGDILRWNSTTLRFETFNVTTALADKADLVDGKIPTSQLPSYVDDVLEYTNLAAFPASGEAGKIYVALDTNLTYRWSGSVYIEISKSLALGETSYTAYRGDRGKTAYDHSQATGNAHGTTASQIPNTPAGTIAATTVQGAINELDADNVQLRADLNNVKYDLNTNKIYITALAYSYTNVEVNLPAGRRYNIKNTTANACTLRDSNDVIILYINANKTYNNVTMPKDVSKLRSVIGTGVVEIEPIDKLKYHSFQNKILHSSNIGLCAFIEEIYLIDNDKYDSFKVLISQANTFIRIIGVKDGVSTNLTNYLYYSTWKKGQVVPLGSAGYAIVNIDYIPYGEFVEYDLINLTRGDNPFINTFLLSTNPESIKYITANSDVNSGADFVGNNAIKDAINFITDASKQTQYIIRCTGHFYFSKITDYIYSAGSASWYGIVGKDYVHLDGISPNNCIIRGDLSQVLAEVQDDVPSGASYSFVKESYGNVITCQWNANADVSNITFVARNIRYPFHTDGSEFGCKDFEETYKNCVFLHEGKYGDSVGTNGGSASGFGLSSGQKITFENCTFNTSHYCHTNKDYSDAAYAIYRDCKFESKSVSITNGINSICLDSPVKSYFVFERCRFDRNSFVSLNTALYNYSNPIAENTADIDVVANGCEPMPIYPSNVNCQVIRITSLSTGINSTVRFDHTSSAFNNLIGDSLDVSKHIDKWFRPVQYGYKYRDGGVGLSGYAQGKWNIYEASIRGYYVTALGKRLGDCSTVNKTLTIIIDATSYNIVFNKNYTNMLNTYILAEINAVISGAGVAESYDVNRDWYPEFGYLETLINGDSTAILRGMGVIISSGKLRRAKNSDGYIDGIALNDAAPNGFCRIMTQGRLNLTSYSNYVIKRVSSETANFSDILENSKWGISPDYDGIFQINVTPYVVKKTYNDSCEIIR